MSVIPVLTVPDGEPEFTLGWGVLAWCSEFIRQPDGPDAGADWWFTREQVRFVLWWYAVDSSGRFLFTRGGLRRAKGWGKSPVCAAVALAELCGPVRFDRLEPDAPGGCVGRPSSAAWVQLAGVSERQTTNTMSMVLAMVAESPIVAEYGLDIGLTRIFTAAGGRLEPITASAPTAEGARPTFVLEDETHWWTDANGGVKLDRVNRRNAGKSRDGSARVLETTNAHAIGMDSVAERTFDAWTASQENKTVKFSILYDSREAPDDVDILDERQLRDALIAVYGDSTWIDLDRVLDEIRDPGTPVSDARRFYLNQTSEADDALISHAEWAAVAAVDKAVADREAITLGFDGSRGRAKGKPDATALIGCRVSDGHLFEIGVWECREGKEEATWTPPIGEIEAAIAMAFKRWSVVGAYFDPAKDWRSFVNAWEAKYTIPPKMAVSRDHPMEWWMTGGRTGLNQRLIEQFEGGVRNRDLSHDGSFKLTQHVLNARRRIRATSLTIGKDNEFSPDKVDACVAAVLAYGAALTAKAHGLGAPRKRVIPRRLY